MHVKHNLISTDAIKTDTNFTDKPPKTKGQLSGRTAVEIDPLKTTLKSASSTHKQLSNIPSQSPKQTPSPEQIEAPLLSSAILITSTPTRAATAYRLDQVHSIHQEIIEQIILKPAAENLLIPLFLDGKTILKNMDSSHVDNLPASALRETPKYAFSQQENGKMAVYIHENEFEDFIQQNLEIHNAKGESVEYDIILLDEDTHSKLHASIQSFVEKFVALKMDADRTKKAEKEDKEIHSHQHVQPFPTSPSYSKPIVKNPGQDPHLQFMPSPQAILRGVMEAKNILSAKEKKKEIAETTKKRRIEEQELKREIRHEEYKKSDIETIEEHHATLHHEIDHEESGRPASVPPTKRRRLEQ